MQNNQPRAFSTASRKEIDIEPNIIEGQLPGDLSGFVFMNSAAGTTNSGGLPFPKYNPDGSESQEYGSPLINGDGMMYRFDFSTPGKLRVKTGLFKTPCYYADVATAQHNGIGDPKYAKLAFKNTGLARISSKLGTRNELNTAITPVILPGETASRLLATFDAGRPFEFDPKTLELITPIGENKQWASGLPPEMDQPLSMVLTTAHPVYDPETREVFTVNFQKNDIMLMMSTRLFGTMFTDMEWVEKEFEKWIHDVEGIKDEELEERILPFINHIHHDAPSKNQSWWQRLLNSIKRKIDNYIYRKVSNKNLVRVLKWNGQKKLDEWTIVDENGDEIAIEHNMHQIGICRDYLILGDTNFKFTLDVMLNYPFPNNPDIDKFLRRLLGGAMNDYSTMYLVPRKLLVPGVDKVKAAKLVLPVETVHFSANYENPDDLVTIHTAHNCCACPAEWLRFYDKRVIDPEIPMDLQKLGLISVGELDIGKIGKIVVKGSTGQLDAGKTTYLYLPGEPGQSPTGPHTWGIGLYTYRDMLSPNKNTSTIEHVYWQSYGLRSDTLTDYILHLYKDPKRNRVYEADQVVEYTKKGAPFVLMCVETANMQATDHYEFGPNTYMWSLQFVPRSVPAGNTPYSKDGYILTTVINGVDTPAGLDYQAELWIFDAAALQKGPVCKLAHPELSFGFTIHSVWVPVADSVPKPSYTLNIRDDYNERISLMREPELKKEVQELFDTFVYPHFS